MGRFGPIKFHPHTPLTPLTFLITPTVNFGISCGKVEIKCFIWVNNQSYSLFGNRFLFQLCLIAIKSIKSQKVTVKTVGVKCKINIFGTFKKKHSNFNFFIDIFIKTEYIRIRRPTIFL